MQCQFLREKILCHQEIKEYCKLNDLFGTQTSRNEQASSILA